MEANLNELALFAGAGGGILGGKLLGWRTVCAVEWDAYARDVLVARQNDGCLEAFPIWNDVQTFDGRPWRGRVDVVSGGFPCQDISAAGKGAGIEGERSGMWKHMARIIGEVLPRFVFVENSPLLVGRGLAVVLADLAALGYDSRWGVVGAHHAAAPHKRDRIWIVADSKSNGHGMGGKPGDVCEEDRGSINGMRSITSRASEKKGNVSDSLRAERKSGARRRGVWEGDSAMADTESETARRLSERAAQKVAESGINGSVCDSAGAGFPHGSTEPVGQPGADAQSERPDWWAIEPDVGRVAHGVACRVDRLRAIGNGQVPAVAALAWNILNQK
jgi:DNA (cytosine-5)-methyltransferase 1